MAGNTLETAAKQLGASRAYQGVGVRETMLDLSAFFAAAEAPVDDETMRGLVEGWTSENQRCEPFSCTDSRTGLPTLAHFERLLYDLSLGPEEDRRNLTVATLYLEWADRGRALTWGQLAEIGRIMLWELASVRATATVHGTNIHVLMGRCEKSYSALKRCIERLDGLKERPAGRAIASFTSLPYWQGDEAWATGQLEPHGRSEPTGHGAGTDLEQPS
ncbi:hypothetical protein AB0N65_06685 [Paenarthrobacter sp. NPDC089322]|uniref:hypothetical protein n=1 Tax=Paenarthrobacter sp. NPDC089322 TaxID=3155065 RepID=UPI00342BB49D